MDSNQRLTVCLFTPNPRWKCISALRMWRSSCPRGKGETNSLALAYRPLAGSLFLTQNEKPSPQRTIKLCSALLQPSESPIEVRVNTRRFPPKCPESKNKPEEGSGQGQVCRQSRDGLGCANPPPSPSSSSCFLVGNPRSCGNWGSDPDLQVFSGRAAS